MRPASVVLVSLATALLGALAAIGIGTAAGWIGDTDTVIVGAQDTSSGDPASMPLRGAAKPLVGGDFSPAEIYEARSPGVVTIFAFFRSIPRSLRSVVAPSSRIWFARNAGYCSSSAMWAAIAPHERRNFGLDFFLVLFAMLLSS